jgi:hypothetical protein
VSARRRVALVAVAGGLALAGAAAVHSIAAALPVADGDGSGATGPDASRARAEARHILAEDRFKTKSLPDPLRGVKKSVGDWLRDTFGSSAPSRGGLVTGKNHSLSPLFWLVTALVVAALVIWASVRIARNRAGNADVEADHEHDQEEITDAELLERMAEAAEESGELEAAIRFRFRAGLLRLDRAGAIEFRPSITSGQVARRLHLPAFDDLASTFDAVAYGGRAPSHPDVDASRREWPRVLIEARRR